MGEKRTAGTGGKEPARLLFHLPPDPSRLLRARERVRDYLQQHCSQADVGEELVMCIEEAATNVIRHSGTDEDLEISLGFAGADLVAEVRDHGRGFDTRSFHPEALPDLLTDHGRGLFLIAQLSDEMQLRSHGGLAVRMVKKAVARRQPSGLETALGETANSAAGGERQKTRVHALLEEIDEAFIAMDWEYRFVHANETALRMAGTSRDELLGRRPWDLWPSFRETAPWGAIREAMELGRPSIVEFHSGVSHTWLEARYYPTPAGISAYYREIGERKQVEEALHDAEARSRDLIRYAPTGIYEIDFRGPSFKTVNDAMCVLTGYEHEELLAKSPMDLLDAESQAAFGERIRRGLAGEPLPDYVEYRVRTKDGRLLDVTLNVSFTRTDGIIDGALVVGYDITERKRIEAEREQLIEELSRSSERARFLADVVETADIAFAVREPDGRLVLFNRAFAELTGYSRAELERGASTVAVALTPPDWWEAETPLLAHAVAERRPVRYEKEYVRKDGSRVPIEVFSQPVFDDAGALVQYRSFLTDISERKRAAEALSESEGRYRALFESTTEGVALHEVVHVDGRAVDYRVLDVNSSFERQTGVPVAQARGRLASELYGTGEAPYLAEYGHVAESGEPYSFEVYFAPLDRHFRITAVSPGRGRFATIFEDISERKRSEAERERLLEESQARAGELATRAELAKAANAINRRIHSSLARDEILQAALEEGVRALSLDAGAIEMREQSAWVVRYQHAFAARDIGLRFSDTEAPNATRTMLSGDALAVADMRTDPSTDVGFVHAHRLRSVLAAPLMVKEAVTGCLLLYGKKVRHFSEAEIDFARKLGAAVSLAIENARLFEAEVEARGQARRELETTRLVLGAAGSLAESLALHDVLDRLAHAILEVGSHSRVTISLWDQSRERLEVATSQGEKPAPAGLIWTFDGLSEPARRAITQPATTLIDYDALEPQQRGASDGIVWRLALDVPLFFGDRFVGLVVIDDPGEKREFSEREIGLMQGIAAQAAVAIENARLFEAERRIAITLQQNFVHPLPQIDGLELDALSLPAARTELIGGDFHDVFVLPGGTVVALIGDVTGKGIKAAGFTETVRSAVRTAAFVKPSPEFILRHVNHLLCHEGEYEQMVTVLLATLDPATGRGSLASAGHPPAVRVSAAGSENIEPLFGPPLGAFEQRYSATDFELGQEEALVLYTDGLTEARCTGETFGEERLLATLRSVPDRAPQALVECLRDAVLSYADELKDDLQVLVLRRTARL